MNQKKRLFIVVNVFILVFLIVTAAVAELPTRPDQVPRVNIVEVRALQSQGTVIFVDTRTAGQWQQARDKIPGAIRLTTQSDLERFKRDVPADTLVVTYCT